MHLTNATSTKAFKLKLWFAILISEKFASERASETLYIEHRQTFPVYQGTGVYKMKYEIRKVGGVRPLQF